MHNVPFFLILTMTQIIVGLITSGGKARRTFGAVIVLAVLADPFFMPKEPPFLRAIVSLTAIMTVLRTIDLARENKPRSAIFRIIHLALPMDTRRFQKARPRFSFRDLAIIVGYQAIAIPALLVVIYVAPELRGVSHWLVRWGFGLVFVYAFTDAVYRTCALAFRAAGYDVYELHASPLLSLSVKEFWGERWNRTVSAWFFEHILRPCARHRMIRLGVFLSFVASGFLHAYLVSSVANAEMTLLMLGYFLLQGLFVMIEMRFRASTWNRAFARAWTIGLMTISSPIFVEPGLRWIGI